MYISSKLFPSFAFYAIFNTMNIKTESVRNSLVFVTERNST